MLFGTVVTLFCTCCDLVMELEPPLRLDRQSWPDNSTGTLGSPLSFRGYNEANVCRGAPAPLSSTDIGAVRRLEDAIATVIRGKPEAIRAAVVTLLARGHC